MKSDIYKFLKSVKDKYGDKLSVYEYDDMWHISYKGRGVDTFTSNQFFEVPEFARRKIIDNVIKRTTIISDKQFKERLKKFKKGKKIF